MITSIIKNAPVNLQYQVIKLAWAQYERAPEALEEVCLTKLNKQALNAQKIMTAVLTSDVANNHHVIEQEIDFVFDQLKEQFEDKKSFYLSLEEQSLTQNELKQAIYQDLLCEKIIDAQSQDYRVATEQDAFDYYEKNKAQFMNPERRHASHILITVNDEYAENKRGNALLRIRGLRAKLLNRGEKFGTLALSNSECPTALHNGLIGTVSKGQLYPELDKVLFAMQANTMSDVVESEIGFHLLYCHEILAAFETDKEDALKEISKQLNQHRKSKCEKQWLASLLITKAS